MRLVTCLCLLGPLVASCVAAASPPNLLLIVADDLGYGDLGCTGSTTIETPSIDRLAASGVLCKRGYVASPVCSPSRAGLLTGRDPRRFGYEDNLNASSEAYATRPALLGLPPTEHTLGDHLRAAGYATSLVGKWHLGTGEPFHPNRRGFDHFCGMLHGGHDYFPLRGQNQIERNGDLVESFSSEYLTDFFTDEALRWIDAQQSDAERRPWFLYLSYNAPHTPMQATEADLAVYAHVRDPTRRTYAAMVRALDRGIGRVLDRIESVGATEQTLVVFLSDNGGATNNASWNGPLSGAKGSLLEGGVRVPMLWSWPGRLPAGAVCESVVSSLDVMTTFVAAAGAKPLALNGPASHEDARNRRRMVRSYGAYDGRDATPLLSGTSDDPAKRFFWRLQGQAAVLHGAEKLIRPSHRPAQLFDVVDDAGERDDLSAADAATRDRLFSELGDWESRLPTVPLWGSSPFWTGESARIYDRWPPRPEPGRGGP